MKRRIIHVLSLFLMSLIILGVSPKESVEAKLTCVHMFGDWVTTQAATCSSKGIKQRTCNLCSFVETSTTSKNASNHSNIVVNTTQSTCTTKGVTKRECTGCGKVLSTTTLPLSAHSYGTTHISTTATCTTSGTKYADCTVCGNRKTWTYTDTGNHSYGTHVVESVAYCNSSGTKYALCTRCGYKKTWSYTNTSNHTYGTHVVENVAYCNSSGTKYALCTRCGNKKTWSYTDTSNHTYGTHMVETVAYCNSSGTRYAICTKCGNKKTWSYSDPDNHILTLYEGQQATCCDTGLIYGICELCAKEFAAVTAINPDNHKAKSGVAYDIYISCDGNFHYYYAYCGCEEKQIYSVKEPEYAERQFAGYGGHTASGHVAYYRCSCGNQYSGATTRLSSCLSCTTPPSARVIIPQQNKIYGSNISNMLISFYVQDNEADKLECRYYVDSAALPSGTMTIQSSAVGGTYTFNKEIAGLADGEHKLRLEVIDPIAPMKSITVPFVIDRSTPKITNLEITTTSETAVISVAASDMLSGVSDYKIQYSTDGVTWTKSDTSEGFFQLQMLTPNTEYMYSIQVSDTAGNSISSSGSFITKPVLPQISVKATGPDSLILNITCSNPANTKYEIHVGNMYATSEGALSSTNQSITLYKDQNSTASIEIKGLLPETGYDVYVTALGSAAENNRNSDSFFVYTKRAVVVHAPLAEVIISNIEATKTSTYISWSGVAGAKCYEIEIDGKTYNAGTECAYVHTGIEPGSVHEYRVRARNSYVKGTWSTVSSIKCLETTPEIPANIKIDRENNLLTVTWNRTEHTEFYEIEINDTVISNISMPYYSIVYEENSAAVIRVRACNKDGNSDWSAPAESDNSESGITIDLDTLPQNPEIFAASIGNCSAVIQWESDSSASYYTVEVDGTQVYAGSAMDNGITVTYSLCSLLAETTYHIKVKAYSYAGFSEGELYITTNTPNQVLTEECVYRTFGYSGTAYENISAGEKVHILLPVSGLQSDSRYTFNISWNSADCTLIDGWLPTAELETSSCYIANQNRWLNVEYGDGITSVSITLETQGEIDEGIGLSLYIMGCTDTLAEFTYNY